MTEYDELLDRVFDDRVTNWTAKAEENEKFPRELIEYLASPEFFAAKWPAGQQHPDVAKVIALARKLGTLARPVSESVSGFMIRRSRSCAASANPST